MFTVLMRVHGSNTRESTAINRLGTVPKGRIPHLTEASPRLASLEVSRMLQVTGTAVSVRRPLLAGDTLCLCFVKTWPVLGSLYTNLSRSCNDHTHPCVAFNLPSDYMLCASSCSLGSVHDSCMTWRDTARLQVPAANTS